MLAVLAACGGAEGPGGERGPIIDSRPQSLQFSEAPALQPGGTAKVSATASSGLAVRYNSSTTGICTGAAFDLDDLRLHPDLAEPAHPVRDGTDDSRQGLQMLGRTGQSHVREPTHTP